MFRYGTALDRRPQRSNPFKMHHISLLPSPCCGTTPLPAPTGTAFTPRRLPEVAFQANISTPYSSIYQENGGGSSTGGTDGTDSDGCKYFLGQGARGRRPLVPYPKPPPPTPILRKSRPNASISLKVKGGCAASLSDRPGGRWLPGHRLKGLSHSHTNSLQMNIFA